MQSSLINNSITPIDVYTLHAIKSIQQHHSHTLMQPLLQVTPLFQEPLDIPTSWMPAIKAAMMLCIALVQLVNTRTLVQSYLNSGLRQWHQLKHGSRVSNPGITTGNVIAIKLRTINTLIVKVCHKLWDVDVLHPCPAC